MNSKKCCWRYQGKYVFNSYDDSRIKLEDYISYIIDVEIDIPFEFCKFMNKLTYFLDNFCVNKYFYVFEQYDSTEFQVI